MGKDITGGGEGGFWVRLRFLNEGGSIRERVGRMMGGIWGGVGWVDCSKACGRREMGVKFACVCR